MLPYQLQVLMNEVGQRLTDAHEAILAYRNSGLSHPKIDLAMTKIEESGGFLAQVQTFLASTFADSIKQDAGVPQTDPAPAPEPAPDMPRLTGPALHAALVGAQANGEYVVGAAYVNEYGPGGKYFNATYTAIAQMDDATLTMLLNAFTTPADWAARVGMDASTIASTWDDVLALSGRTRP